MDDKTIMENLLTTVKSASDLYLHGTIEATTANVRCAFDNALTTSLQMQNDIHCKMSEKGWYPNTQVEQQKITQTMQKFSQQQ